MSDAIDPSRIMQIGSGFWASKVFLTAVSLEVFTKLGSGPRTGAELEQELGLHPRGTWDFLDALVAMGFLERDGDGKAGRYRNAPDADHYLDKKKPTYIGGILEMFDARLFKYWNDLPEALRTGKPQNEIKETGVGMFDELYKSEEKLEGFMNAMTGISLGNFIAFAEKFDFSKYRKMCDVGGATAQLSRVVAKRHPHLSCISFDLPAVAPIAQRHIESDGLSDRVSVASGDFFKDPLPKADMITMGMILHDWGLEKKMLLIRAAYDALPEGGALVAVENVIDDARRENLFGMLMSLNMLIEFGDGFDFTGADFDGWCREAGFRRTEVIHLAGPCSAAVAYK